MIGSTILNIFVNELLAKEKNHIALHWLFRVIRARLQPPIKANDMPGKDLLKKVVVINKKRGTACVPCWRPCLIPVTEVIRESGKEAYKK